MTKQTEKTPDARCGVSIIIPAYNEERYILEALDSVYTGNRDFSDFEVLLVDDCSTDRTRHIVEEKYGGEVGKRLHIVTGQQQGVSGARNLALDRAKGRYVLFCDADDRLGHNSIRQMYERAETTGADIVIGEMQGFHTFGENVFPVTRELAQMEEIDRFHPLLYRTMMITAKLYRRQMLEENHIRFLPIAYSEDAAFYMECVYKCRAIYGMGTSGQKTLVMYEYRKRTFLEPASVTQRFELHLWRDFMTSNQYIFQMIDRFCPENMREEYRLGFTQRVCENLIRGFWRNYWLCTEECRNEMLHTLLQYRQILSKANRWDETVVLSLEDQYLGLNEENPKPYEEDVAGRKYGVAVLIGADVTGEKLKLVQDSLYHQNFPSFCVVMNQEQKDSLPASYKNMENIYISDREDLVSEKGELKLTGESSKIYADYLISLQYPLGVQATALSRMVGEMLAAQQENQKNAYPVVAANVFDKEMRRFDYRLMCKTRLVCSSVLQHCGVRMFMQSRRFKGSENLWKTETYQRWHAGIQVRIFSKQSRNAVMVEL